MRFVKKQARKRDAIIGLDLGSRQWKGVIIQQTANGLKLVQYVVLPCPATPGKTDTQTAGAETLQTIVSQLRSHERSVVVAISSSSSIMTGIEMPRTSPEELHTAISLNSFRYLRRDLSGYYFDAVELTDGGTNGKTKRSPMMQVFVAAAPRDEVLWYRNTLAAAKLKAETIELSGVTVINALQRTHAQLCEQNIVLLLDIGHQLTRLIFLSRGLPLLTRVMPWGGAQITEQIAVALGLQPVAAEQHKHAMSEQVAPFVRDSLQMLVREVRSSIDFVERQHDCAVRHAFAGGGTACNRAILDALSDGVGLPIQRWNPLEGYDTTELNVDELEAIAPCLGAAVGVAVAKL